MSFNFFMFEGPSFITSAVLFVFNINWIEPITEFSLFFWSIKLDQYIELGANRKIVTLATIYDHNEFIPSPQVVI